MLFFLRFWYFQREHVQIVHVLSLSNKVRGQMKCNVDVNVNSFAAANVKYKENDNRQKKKI